MNSHSLHDNVFAQLTTAFDEPGEYDQHPPDAVLRGYVEGKLPGGSRRTAAIVATFPQGDVADWRHAEVGLHVKTCTRCWPIIIEQRQALSKKTPATAVNKNWLQQAFPWFQPRLQLVGVGASYALVLLVGMSVGIWFNSKMEEAALDDVSSIMPTLSSLPTPPEEKLVDLLRQSGVDLFLFDLDQPLILYQIQAKDSLRSIAQAQWDAPERWIILYLLNYDVLKEIDRPAIEPLTLQTLRLPTLK